MGEDSALPLALGKDLALLFWSECSLDCCHVASSEHALTSGPSPPGEALAIIDPLPTGLLALIVFC